MKTLLTLVTLMALSSAAHASWYQEFCSNSEATIRVANGHNENFIQLTKRTFDNGNMNDSVIRDEQGELRVVEKKNKEISKEETKGCRPGDKHGWYASRKVMVSQVKIVRDNGGLFDKDIVGVSKDLKSVNAALLCEENLTSEMMCGRK